MALVVLFYLDILQIENQHSALLLNQTDLDIYIQCGMMLSWGETMNAFWYVVLETWNNYNIVHSYLDLVEQRLGLLHSSQVCPLK